jgi:hypothetical protein
VLAPGAFPFFFLAPTALLLLLSGPRTVREWLWIGLAVVSIAVLLRFPATLPDQTLRAAAAFFVGAYVVAALGGGTRALLSRTLVAIGVAAVATIGWFLKLGLAFRDLEAVIVTTTWTQWRELFPSFGLPEVPADAHVDVVVGSPLAGASDLVQELSRATATIGELYPAMLAMYALVGGWLAWSWYHRLASRPIGNPPPQFRTFRFSDHFIWALVILGGLVLIDLPRAPEVAVRNLLLLVVTLYAGRGLAVIRTAMIPAPRFFVVLLCLAAVPVLALVPLGCAVLGVADTWIDLRRRMPPPQGVVS